MMSLRITSLRYLQAITVIAVSWEACPFLAWPDRTRLGQIPRHTSRSSGDCGAARWGWASADPPLIYLETFVLPPDVLLQKRRPQIEHLLGAVLEHAQDRLSVGNVERHDPGFAVVGALRGARRGRRARLRGGRVRPSRPRCRLELRDLGWIERCSGTDIRHVRIR